MQYRRCLVERCGKHPLFFPHPSQDRPVRENTANAVDRFTEGFSSTPSRTAQGQDGKTPVAYPKSSQNLYRGGWADDRDRAWLTATKSAIGAGKP